MACDEKRRTLATIESSLTSHDGHITQTYADQEEVEEQILDIYQRREGEDVILHRERHITFLRRGLCRLSDHYQALDASRPWLCYWILHSLNLLDEKISKEESSQISKFLSKCQDCRTGGFGGGPGQFAHLAATYAALNALVSLCTTEALSVVNREHLLKFIQSMKMKDGSFRMHRGGEIDVRAVYCAVVVAKLTNLFTSDRNLFQGTAQWVARCQTFEGGFGGNPGMEAHGGYTFCAVATLIILDSVQLINEKALLRWLNFRQMSLEGGFQGRTNKLVDGCYAFWQGACFCLMGRHYEDCLSSDISSDDKWLFNRIGLQEYILICCQHSHGGLIDKPGKPRDYYHTCYALSGLAASQHLNPDSKVVLGNGNNIVKKIHPIFNLTADVVTAAETFYGSTVVVEVLDEPNSVTT